LFTATPLNRHDFATSTNRASFAFEADRSHLPYVDLKRRSQINVENATWRNVQGHQREVDSTALRFDRKQSCMQIVKRV
jgi:hypothetical protein